jgi:hypothetical protein
MSDINASWKHTKDHLERWYKMWDIIFPAYPRPAVPFYRNGHEGAELFRLIFTRVMDGGHGFRLLGAGTVGDADCEEKHRDLQQKVNDVVQVIRNMADGKVSSKPVLTNIGAEPLPKPGELSAEPLPRRLSVDPLPQEPSEEYLVACPWDPLLDSVFEAWP